MDICGRDSDLTYLGFGCPPPPEQNPGYAPGLLIPRGLSQTTAPLDLPSHSPAMVIAWRKGFIKNIFNYVKRYEENHDIQFHYLPYPQSKCTYKVSYRKILNFKVTDIFRALLFVGLTKIDEEQCSKYISNFKI